MHSCTTVLLLCFLKPHTLKVRGERGRGGGGDGGGGSVILPSSCTVDSVPIRPLAK